MAGSAARVKTGGHGQALGEQDRGGGGGGGRAGGAGRRAECVGTGVLLWRSGGGRDGGGGGGRVAHDSSGHAVGGGEGLDLRCEMRRAPRRLLQPLHHEAAGVGNVLRPPVSRQWELTHSKARRSVMSGRDYANPTPSAIRL